MELILTSVLTNLTIILVTFLVGIVTFYKWKFTYWKRKNLPYIEPSIPFGTAENFFTRKEYIGCRIKRRYDEAKAKRYKHVGMYMFASPTYLPVDPEYIKNIMARDFRHFSDRGIYVNEKKDPLSSNLFNVGGHKWKYLRTKLTPAFTSGKMKMMFTTLVQSGEQLKVAVGELQKRNLPLEAKEISGCFTTDVIASCAFGLDCNSFVNPNNEFRQYGKRIFGSLSQARSIGAAISFANQDLARLLGVVITPDDITEFFMRIVKQTVEYRKKNNVIRKDFMQILIDLQDDAKNPEERLTIKEMTANVFIFFLAGFETSSTTISFCLYELARNPDIQEKVRDEVLRVLEKHGGEISYEAIADMKYTGQVIDETLRKYPPGAIIPRLCIEDYKIPETDVVIEKGTIAMMPVYALHHDPDYYPNPDEFDPERFTDENKSKRNTFTYLPFGEGPRICIGLRFGLVQAKVGLAVLLKNYAFSLNEKTEVPLELDPFNLVLTSKNGIWLDIHEISGTD